MKKLIHLIFLVHFVTVSAQIGLPVQNSLLPKNSLVVDYDFSKPISYIRGGTSVNSMTGNGSGTATLVQSPNFMNSLGFLSFNGTNQYLVSPNLRSYFKSVNSSIQKSFTMSLWVYPTKSNGIIVSELDSQTPSGGWHASNIEIVNNTIYYRIWNGTAISSLSSVSLNQWYHLAMVYDGVRLKAYLNGVLQGTQTNDRELPTSGQYYTLAASETTHMGSGGVNGGFNCAQFKLFQLPLTDSDILQEYNLRKDEFYYTLHSPSTNTNPTYWSTSSNFSGDSFYANAPFPTTVSGYHFTPWLNSPQGWSAGTNDTNQFITLNYDEPIIMKGIVSQGRASNGGQWISSAHIDVSLNGSAWTRVMSNATLNSNSVDDVRVLFPSPIYAKSVRVSPTNWNNHITTRMGLLVQPNNIAQSNLVLHYNPGNSRSYTGTGTALNDLSGNVINGTMRNATFSSNTLNFNGTNADVSIADNALLEPGSGSWTIEVWFNNAGTSGTVIGKYRNGGGSADISYALRLMGAGSIRADFGNGSTAQITDNYSFDSNTWVQMVYVWDKTNNNIYTYSNGSLKQTKAITLSGSILNTSTNLFLGSYNGGEYSQYFNGKLGVVRIYRKALNSAEILTNYNTTKELYDGLEVKLDASNNISYPGSGTTWSDVSGNGNHATLTNGPVFNSSNGGQFFFDGVNDFASGGAITSTSGNNSRTVILWYKSTANRNTVLLDKGALTDDTAEQLFLAASNSVGVGSGSYPPTNTGGVVLCFWGNDYIYPISSSTLFDGNWHFIAYTYNNANRSVSICFDGIFANTIYQWNLGAWTTLTTRPFISPRVLNTTNNPYWIGQSRAAFWGYGGTFSSVNIPLVQIYSRSLAELEILNIYNSIRTRF